jgi:hypothetical protein
MHRTGRSCGDVDVAVGLHAQLLVPSCHFKVGGGFRLQDDAGHVLSRHGYVTRAAGYCLCTALRVLNEQWHVFEELSTDQTNQEQEVVKTSSPPQQQRSSSFLRQLRTHTANEVCCGSCPSIQFCPAPSTIAGHDPQAGGIWTTLSLWADDANAMEKAHCE